MTDTKKLVEIKIEPVGSSSSSPVLTCGDKVWLFVERWRLGDWVIAVMLFVVFGILTTVPPHRQLFDPTDPAILYPLLEESISDVVLVVIAQLIPLILFIIIAIFQRHLPHAAAECNTVILGLLFSFAATLVCTESLKKAIGQPRPNLIAYSGFVSGTFTSHKANEAFQSFPSGHASVSFSGLLHLSLYLLYLVSSSSFVNKLQRTKFINPAQRNHMWKILIAILPIIVAFYIAVTRVREYYHHTQDVLAGAIIGSVISYATFTYNFYHLPIVPFDGANAQ
jgi:diacylglycerol diphosphate phosphatase/phosphatidate phosphatase